MEEKNYTRPNQEKGNPGDLQNGLFILAKGIGMLLEDNTGIVVKLEGEMSNPIDDSEKVIIINTEGRIVIDSIKEDLDDGTICRIELQGNAQDPPKEDQKS